MSRDLDQTIFVAGHRGMVTSAIVRCLQALGHRNLVTAAHAELDLIDQAAVRAVFARQPINLVVLAAPKRCSRQRHLPGRDHGQEPVSAVQGDQRRAPSWRAALAAPGIELHQPRSTAGPLRDDA